MAKIDLTIYPERLKNSIKRARERNIVIPTFAQMRDPNLIPDKIKEKLKSIGLWDINPRNLFRITWKNEPKVKGGQFNGVNYFELPKSFTGVDARIIVLVGISYAVTHRLKLIPNRLQGVVEAALEGNR